MNNHLTILF